MFQEEELLKLLDLEEKVHKIALGNEEKFKQITKIFEWLRMCNEVSGTNNTGCHFCFKKKDQVQLLISGPGVCICNDCVDVCNDIILSRSNDNNNGSH